MRDRRDLYGFLLGLTASMALVLLAFGAPAAAYHRPFTQWCNNTFWNTSAHYRWAGQDYAYTAALDGYQWGGGCWNEDNVDHSPGDPPEDPNSAGEGADCSGLVFKSWFERAEVNDPGWRYHMKMQNVHGPYSTYSFKAGSGAPNTTVAKANTVYMDAFVSNPHIGMIYWAHTGYNQDRIVEAKSEADGSGTWPRTYRGNPAYTGARRVGWLG